MFSKPDFREAQSFLEDHPHVSAVDLLLADTNGIFRGKRVTVTELEKIYTNSMFLAASMFALDIRGHTVEETGLGFSIGDADLYCWPIPGTLVPIPWLDGSFAQLQVTMHEVDGTGFFADPRHVLKRVLSCLDELELTPVVAVEMEFYFIDNQRDAEGGPQPPVSPANGHRKYSAQINEMSDLDEYSAILDDIHTATAVQQIPAGVAMAEYGPGQYEINLRHVADACLACDHAVRLKRLIKGTALRHGMEATFMAKPYDDDTGNGMHVHVSLLDKHGHNIFASDDPAGSPVLHHALGGLMNTMRDSMAIFAPNANSYRRFQPESYVPLSPTWGVNNRTAALRIPAGTGGDRRIEHRVAGADANPYLLVAAILAGMHHGIKGQLDPGPETRGNAYEQETPSAPPLPDTWLRALNEFSASSFIEDYFGRDYIKVFVANKRAERREFVRYVSPIEHEWYMRKV